MDLLLVGLSHKTAPVEVRERFAFSESEAGKTLPELRERAGADEILLLSTCNRTEVLAVGRSDKGLTPDRVIESLCGFRSPDVHPSREVFYSHCCDDAVRHVLRVGAGLDSMVLGEPQIFGQLKQAYSIASDAGTQGRMINKILHLAFQTGKRVRTETELGYGAVSVAHVAVSLARKVFGNFARHTALIIGAGEMSETAARQLRELEIGSLLFVNRTREKADLLALEFDGEAIAFSDLLTGIERADIVISSTGAPGFILDHDTFHQVMDRRHTRPIFLVDIAVPRDIDPAINDHANAFLYDIDNLQEVADQNLSRRQEALPGVEAIIEEQMTSYHRWQERQQVEPVVKLLHRRFDEVRRCEVEKNQKRFGEANTSDLHKMTQAIQKKLLHRPAEILRKCDADSEEGRRTLEIIRELFDL